MTVELRALLSLVVLDLRLLDNEIGQIVARCPSLTNLNLSGNNIGDAGAVGRRYAARIARASMARALVDNRPCDPDEAKTVGVNHQIWVTPWSPAGDGRTQLNIWDFGGQEILYQTHRYFLTERCVQLIVLDRRFQDDTQRFPLARHRACPSPAVTGLW